MFLQKLENVAIAAVRLGQVYLAHIALQRGMWFYKKENVVFVAALDLQVCPVHTHQAKNMRME